MEWCSVKAQVQLYLQKATLFRNILRTVQYLTYKLITTVVSYKWSLLVKTEK